ncbi:hypothetical protein LCGC14_1544430, partial [marine sediment metagenome]
MYNHYFSQTKGDFNKVIKLIPLIDEIINYVREDPNHS